MAYAIPNREELEARLRNYFAAAGFDNIIPGTPEHALLNIFADNLQEAYTAVQSKYNEVLPMNATGALLDSWAEFFGITRGISNYAYDSSNHNAHFYIAESSRASVNNGEELFIPAGISLTVDGSKVYTTTSSTTIGTTPPYVGFVAVKSAATGSFYNIEPEELNTHDLTSILPDTSGVELIEVSNKFAITSGTFPQLDNALQLDIQNAFSKNIGTNLEGILQQVNNLAGVSFAEILNARRGTGTFNVFIDSTSPIVSPSLLQQVQEIVDSEQALGVTGYVEYPSYKAVKIKFEVSTLSDVDSAGLISSLEGIAQDSILNTVNNITRGGTLITNELLRIVLDAENVITAQIKELKIGEYSVIDNKIINEEAVAPGPKSLEWNEKWFTSKDLISFCVANG